MTRSVAFTSQAWQACSAIRGAIDEHPFLIGLAGGTLSRTTFVEYLSQDAHYLIGYARALALCAAQATDGDQISFWASSAHDAIIVERALHESHVDDLRLVRQSPTCTAYLSFLLSTATQGCYPALAAALLPCFWIYQDVGARLLARVETAGHPYGDWISTYADPAFEAATARARDIVDELAERSSPEVRTRMLAAFDTAARYEWMFFDAAWRGETWPDLGDPTNNAITQATPNEDTDADSHG